MLYIGEDFKEEARGVGHVNRSCPVQEQRMKKKKKRKKEWFTEEVDGKRTKCRFKKFLY